MFISEMQAVQSILIIRYITSQLLHFRVVLKLVVEVAESSSDLHIFCQVHLRIAHIDSSHSVQ